MNLHSKALQTEVIDETTTVELINGIANDLLDFKETSIIIRYFLEIKVAVAEVITKLLPARSPPAFIMVMCKGLHSNGAQRC